MRFSSQLSAVDRVVAVGAIVAVAGLSRSDQSISSAQHPSLATLASSCDAGDRPEWNGTSWVCSIGVRAPVTLTYPGTLFEATSRAEPSLGKYAMTVVDHALESPFRYLNKTLQFGYNYKDGSQDDPKEASVFLQFESKYQLNNSPEPGRRVNETHLSGVDLSGLEHRHYSNAAAWDGSFGITTISATTLDLVDWDQTPLGQLTSRGLDMSVPILGATAGDVKLLLTNADKTLTNFQIADSGNSLRHALIIDAENVDALSVMNSKGTETRVAIKSGATNANVTQLVQDASERGDFAILTGVPAAAIKMFTGAAGLTVHTPAFGAALEVTDAGVTRALGGLEVVGKLYSGSAAGPTWTSGTGAPESVVTAPVGSLYTRTDGGAGSTLYVKENGTGNTGWVAK